jgi:outer membrane protein assembly factor BamB
MPRLKLVCVAMLAATVAAPDWPQWGRDSTRNAVSLERGPPLDFQLPVVESGKLSKPERSIAWFGELGSRTIGTPSISDGLVWIGTNVRYPEVEPLPKDWDGGVLMCFRESDGETLWKHRSPRLGTGPVEDFTQATLGSAPHVEGDRLWYVNNRCEAVCFDIAPLKKGTGAPREVWKFDMRKELNVFQHLMVMQGGGGAAVAVLGDRLFVTTHNGVDETHANLPSPDAPSLICLDKATGKLLWKDSSPGKGILCSQISSPLVGEVKGRKQVVVGQGDGWLRSFDPATGKLLWKCDLNAKDADYRGEKDNRNYVVATPILYDDRVYIATGRDVENGSGPGGLYCIDPTKVGDVSRELDAGPKKGKPNPNSGVVWYTPPTVPDDAPRIEVGKNKKRDLLRNRDYYFGRTIAGVTAHEGLLYAADFDGFFYCFEAKTGKLHWVEYLKSSVWGQPLWVDGKVYVASDDTRITVFAHGREKKQLAKFTLDLDVQSGLVFAKGTMYVASHRTLYAIRAPK